MYTVFTKRGRPDQPVSFPFWSLPPQGGWGPWLLAELRRSRGACTLRKRKKVRFKLWVKELKS